MKTFTDQQTKAPDVIICSHHYTFYHQLCKYELEQGIISRVVGINIRKQLMFKSNFIC